MGVQRAYNGSNPPPSFMPIISISAWGLWVAAGGKQGVEASNNAGRQLNDLTWSIQLGTHLGR